MGFNLPDDALVKKVQSIVYTETFILIQSDYRIQKWTSAEEMR
jgi:hypothetical protein